MFTIKSNRIAFPAIRCKVISITRNLMNSTAVWHQNNTKYFVITARESEPECSYVYATGEWNETIN